MYYVVRTALRVVRLFFEAVEQGKVTLQHFEADWAMPTYKIARLAIIVLGIVIAYPYIPGADSAAFKGVSLFLGVVLSLGSSTAVSNIIAGYMMTYRRAFRVGDRVSIGEVVGDVTAMRLQVTHLRTTKNEEVVVPNSSVISGHVINYSTLARKDGLLLHTTVRIGYETPWRQVEALLLEAASRTDGLAALPQPFVLQTALGEFAVSYELNVGCADPHQMFPLYSAVHRNILDVFNEYGVPIMVPAYEGDPEKPKVVPREKWYAPPAKREEA
jgi:small-conductance mechanosensitive channel